MATASDSEVAVLSCGELFTFSAADKDQDKDKDKDKDRASHTDTVWDRRERLRALVDTLAPSLRVVCPEDLILPARPIRRGHSLLLTDSVLVLGARPLVLGATKADADLTAGTRGLRARTSVYDVCGGL